MARASGVGGGCGSVKEEGGGEGGSARLEGYGVDLLRGWRGRGRGKSEAACRRLTGGCWLADSVAKLPITQPIS